MVKIIYMRFFYPTDKEDEGTETKEGPLDGDTSEWWDNCSEG